MARSKTNVFGGETIPQPLVQELAPDNGWDEWSQALQQQEVGFAPTAPAPLALLQQKPEPAPLAKPAGVTLQRGQEEARRNARVCPQPAYWTRLYVILARARTGTVRLPSPPLAGAAWNGTPMVAKRLCFLEQLEWADKHGCLKDVFEFLVALPENGWYYAG